MGPRKQATFDQKVPISVVPCQDHRARLDVSGVKGMLIGTSARADGRRIPGWWGVILCAHVDSGGLNDLDQKSTLCLEEPGKCTLSKSSPKPAQETVSRVSLNGDHPDSGFLDPWAPCCRTGQE